MQCDIDIFIDGDWVTAGQFEAFTDQVDRGYRGSGHFSYDLQFVTEYSERSNAALSCRYPVSFEIILCEAWPAFLLDLLPSGAARREMLSFHGLQNGANADWPLLLRGAGNPSGNLRIHQAAIEIPKEAHPGFDRNDVLERGEGFIEYARDHGAPVSGSSGAQGDAPKFLLAEDMSGRWHADGALADAHVFKHWLVKFPRGKLASDRQVLRNEAAYYRVAERMGLHVGEPLIYESDTLFIPRFDREISDGHVSRYGLESLCSLAGVAEFGARLSHDRLVRSIAEYSTNVQADVEEYLLRDVMNVALGNTDNHSRNTAMLKKNGEVRLSPLYDFAPMILDDQGIARVCRWEGNEGGGYPNWEKVVESINDLSLDIKSIQVRLDQFVGAMIHLPGIMTQCGVDEELINRLGPRIDNVRQQLSRTISGLLL